MAGLVLATVFVFVAAAMINKFHQVMGTGAAPEVAAEWFREQQPPNLSAPSSRLQAELAWLALDDHGQSLLSSLRMGEHTPVADGGAAPTNKRL